MYPEAAEVVARFPIIDSWPVTADHLEELIEEFVELVERYRGVAYVPRTAEATLKGSGSDDLVLPHVMVSAVSDLSIDGIELTGAEIAEQVRIDSEPGVLVRRFGWARSSTVDVSFTHGTSETPTAVRRACFEFVRAKAADIGVPDGPRNAIAYEDPATGWSYRESTADWDAGRPTGLRAVDDALNTLVDYRTPVVA